MNKREAISYAQITLDYMQSSKYNNEINPDTLGIEMKQSFKQYPKNLVLVIVDARAKSRKKLQEIKNRSDNNE